MRVFVGGIHLESNSFTPLRTGYKDFDFVRGEDMFTGVAGVQTLADAGCEVIPSLFADAVPGGLVVLEDFLKITDEILAALPADGSVDGVLLVLHGALEVERLGSGEAYLLSRVHEKVGPKVPISVALDLHGNNTYTLARLANLVYGYRTAPHTDIDETRVRAAELLLRAMREKALPWTILQRIPLMLPGESMMTTAGPGQEIIRRLDELDQTPGVWASSYFAGMPWVDCPQNGSALLVNGVGDKAPALKATKDLAAYIWGRREEFTFQGGLAMPPDEAIAWAKDPARKTPVFLSDSADNVTAGASGDNAYFLQKVLDAGLRRVLFAAIIDPESVKTCFAAREGDILPPIGVGRVMDEASHQVQLLSAKLVRCYPASARYGKAALVRTNGVDILLFDRREPVFTEQDLAYFGLLAKQYHAVVVKQGYLSPQLTAAAGDSVMVLTPGNCAQDLQLLQYKNIRRPMWPFDAFDWAP